MQKKRRASFAAGVFQKGWFIVYLKPDDPDSVDLTDNYDRLAPEAAIVYASGEVGNSNDIQLYRVGKGKATVGKLRNPKIMSSNALRRQKIAEMPIYGKFPSNKECVNRFNALSTKTIEEAVVDGVTLAKTVVAVPLEAATVQGNAKNINRLAVAVVDTTIPNKITPEKEIANIDKILLCARGIDYKGKKAALHVTYIVFASIIAAAGLWTDSGPSVVASMLVSSMMEPIKGMTTAIISDKGIIPWQRRFAYHLLTLLFDMCICLAVGAVAGGIASYDMWEEGEGWTTNGQYVPYTLLEYLSGKNMPDARRQIIDGSATMLLPGEMYGRTNSLGLWVAIVVAGASAIALNFADRADNKSALVGIGISASLLPPMVNAGMLWTIAQTNKVSIDGKDFATLGAVSFALTWINVGVILLVWAVSYRLRGEKKEKKETQAMIELQANPMLGERNLLLF